MAQRKKQIQPGVLFASIAGKIRGDLSIPEELSGDVLAMVEWVFVPAYKGLRLATLNTAAMKKLQSEKPCYYQEVLSYIQNLESHFRERGKTIKRFLDGYPNWFIEITTRAKIEKDLLDAAPAKPEKRSMIRKFLQESNAFSTRKNKKGELVISPIKVTPSFIGEMKRMADAEGPHQKTASAFLDGLRLLDAMQYGEQANFLDSWLNHLIYPLHITVTKEDVKQARKSIRKHLPNK